MSDTLEIYIDSNDLSRAHEESLIIVPRESWSRELRKVFASSASDREKALALSQDAASMYPGSKLFEPRFSAEFEEMDGEVIFGIPYSIHEDRSERDIETLAIGIFKDNDSWKYLSTLNHPSPTSFPLVDHWSGGDDGVFASAAFIGDSFKLIRESADELKAFGAHRFRSETAPINLSEIALAQIFDFSRTIASYNEITFILTGHFESTSTAIPAVDTGNGYAAGANVFIQLGTSSSPCFILGKGGDTSTNGGGALRLSDIAPTFSITKGNSASVIGGGGGGGCSFQCLSLESKSALAIRGGGGASSGFTNGSQDDVEKSANRRYKKKVLSASSSNAQVQYGKIRSIVGGVVEIIDSSHSLTNGSRVIISDIEALTGDSNTYFVKSTGPQKFKLYSDSELSVPVDTDYSCQAAKIKKLTSTTGLGGLGEKLYGTGIAGGLALEVETFSHPLIDTKNDEHSENIKFENMPDSYSEIDFTTFAAVITTPQAAGITTWAMPSITGDFADATYADGDSAPTMTLLQSSSGQWSFIGREGVMGSEDQSLLGYKSIAPSANGGWFGEDGDKTEINKIHDPSKHRDNSAEGLSQSYQLGGYAGAAIETSTTNVSGTNAIDLAELELQPWVLGSIKTFNNSPSLHNNKAFDQLKDFNDEYVQETLATSMVLDNLLGIEPKIVGGALFDVAGNVTASGIFSE